MFTHAEVHVFAEVILLKSGALLCEQVFADVNKSHSWAPAFVLIFSVVVGKSCCAQYWLLQPIQLQN